MVKVYLYGLLAKEFGNFFKLNVSSCFSALKAIDTNKKKFFDRINYLSKNGIDYIIIIDNEKIFSKEKFLEIRKIKNIHILPAISGFGQAAGTVGSQVAVKMGLTVAQKAGEKAVLTAVGQVVAFLINTAVSATVQIGISLVMGALMKGGQPPAPGGITNIGAGGGAIMVEASNKSYIFSNAANTTSQGAQIPLGYGKTIIASKVIWNAMRNYSSSENFIDQFNIPSNALIFNDYIT